MIPVKKAFRTIMTAALVFAASVSSVFADIAPLPEPEPVKSGIGVPVILAVVIAALVVLRIVLHRRNK